MNIKIEEITFTCKWYNCISKKPKDSTKTFIINQFTKLSSYNINIKKLVPSLN